MQWLHHIFVAFTSFDIDLGDAHEPLMVFNSIDELQQLTKRRVKTQFVFGFVEHFGLTDAAALWLRVQLRDLHAARS